MNHTDRAARSRRPGRLGVIAIALAFGLTSLRIANPAPTFAWSAGSYSAADEAQLVALTNQARASAGLRALTVDWTLTSIARWRSQDMITRNYFSHQIPPSGESVFDVMTQKGYCYQLAGENIGWNNYPDDIATAAIQQAFMASPDHRANIMGSSWNVIGVGTYKGSDGKKMYTVLFANKCGAAAPAPKPTPKPTPRPTPKPTPRPTTRPTTRPTVRPTPIAKSTPRPVQPTPGPVATATQAAAPSPTIAPTPAPSPQPAILPTGAPAPSPIPTDSAGLRVIDPPTQQGLFESIVGGVTGFFFGN